MNDGKKVNIDDLPPQEVERLLMEKFEALLSEVFGKSNVTTLGPPTADLDFTAFAKTPSGAELQFLVECKAHPRPSQVPPAPGRLAEDNVPSVSLERRFNPNGTVQSVRSWVFGAPFISPRLGEVCWDRGWGWFDLAGNCRVTVPNLLYLERRGQAPVHRVARPDANLGTPEAARVLRALLNPARPPRWDSQRELQQATAPSVSLGLVHKVVTHLRQEGFLATDGGDGLRVVDPERLLLAWRDAYRFERLRRFEWFTLLKPPEIERVIREVNLDNEPHVAWAAFSAAERLEPMVRQPKHWLMTVEESPESLRQALRAEPVETGANLTLLMAPDRSYLSNPDHQAAPAACTSPLQTYLDTWHAGGRGQEAAEAILERRLRPAWKKFAA